jgi:hypothetical protein
LGQNTRIGRYVTPETIRLGLSAFSAGLTAGLVWRAAGRTRWNAMVVAGVIGVALAGTGAVRLIADPAGSWTWAAAAALISVAGVWAGVPETGPALLAAGALVALVATAGVTRARWAPTAGIGLAAVIGWAALSGAAGRPWAAVGGALCTGLAPWIGLRSLFAPLNLSPSAGPWLLGSHVALVIIAARWIGVDPQAGWARVAAVAFAGIAVSIATPRQA